MMLRVGVVDDQALVRAGFSMILEPEPDLEVVCEAANGRQAGELCRRYRPAYEAGPVRPGQAPPPAGG